jgi:hypothetical protein
MAGEGRKGEGRNENKGGGQCFRSLLKKQRQQRISVADELGGKDVSPCTADSVS